MKDKVLSRFSSRLLINCFVFLIKTYQKLLSPLTLPSCRYLPTCSQYALEAFEKYGMIKGCLLTTKRFLSCHPFAQSRVDEVP